MVPYCLKCWCEIDILNNVFINLYYFLLRNLIHFLHVYFGKYLEDGLVQITTNWVEKKRLQVGFLLPLTWKTIQVKLYYCLCKTMPWHRENRSTYFLKKYFHLRLTVVNNHWTIFLMIAGKTNYTRICKRFYLKTN